LKFIPELIRWEDT